MPPSKSAVSLSRLRDFLKDLLFNPRYYWLLAAFVIVGDAVFTQLIVRFVPYTEIDFETYMHHISLYNAGERDYTLIKGPTGPLVYPAGHVHIHRYLDIVTSHGANRLAAQTIYWALYICTLALTCLLYGQTRSSPNWLLLLLPLSKRLHSIYVLRLFNDCWSVALVFAAISAYAMQSSTLGSFLYSAALSVKMNILLYLPGLLFILFIQEGLTQTLAHIIIIVSVQIFLALPFLQDHADSYLRNAFDLSRVFLYKWTVNWRFLSEERFLSPSLSKLLLVGHVSALLIFCIGKWSVRHGGLYKIVERGLRRPTVGAGLTQLSSDEIITILFTCNLIGVTFARSLHYQFYSWYGQQLPLVAWKTPFPIVMKVVLLGCIEYAWNVFPSTPLSSGLLLASNISLIVGLWVGSDSGKKKSK